MIGSKAPLLALDGTVTGAVQRDGSVALTGEWDIGEDMSIRAERLEARDGEGLRIEDDGGNVGVFVEDGGDVGIGHAAPVAPFDLTKTAEITAGILAIYQGKRSGQNLNVEYYHTGNYATTNQMELGLNANTNNGGANNKRTAVSFNASFDAVADATRNSLLRIGTAIAGTFGWAVAMTGKTLGLFNAAASPQGALHVHNGTGGMIFVTKTGIDGTAQTILPNATGDVARYFYGLAAVTDGTTGAGVTVAGTLGANIDQAVGTLTVRFTVAADGSLTVKRQAGTGTATWR